MASVKVNTKKVVIEQEVPDGVTLTLNQREAMALRCWLGGFALSLTPTLQAIYNSLKSYTQSPTYFSNSITYIINGVIINQNFEKDLDKEMQ